MDPRLRDAGEWGGRRQVVGVTASSWACLGLIFGAAVMAQEHPREQAARDGLRAAAPSRTSPAISIDAATARAIQRGLAFLARRQNPDGSWTDRVGRKVHMEYRGTVAPHVGVTALAGLAFLSGGTLPDQGPTGLGRSLAENYCEVVRKALDYVMNQTQANGFISANTSRMYSHAFATLFLAEAYGTGLSRDDERLKECLQRAVRLIVKAQNKEGGWRYHPGAEDSDMSITVCQVMALRAARNAGIEVPRETIQNAIRYVKESFQPNQGAFAYQLSYQRGGFPSRTSFALTAAGVTTLYGAGDYSAYEIREGLRYLWRHRPRLTEARGNFDYYYGQYYAVQAMFQAGGEYWRQWYDYIRRDLLELQDPQEGCWTDLVGSNYATAMSTIILQFPNQYLPITEN
jgi:hypothetical protein